MHMANGRLPHCQSSADSKIEIAAMHAELPDAMAFLYTIVHSSVDIGPRRFRDLVFAL